MPELTGRARQVLYHCVTEYVATGEPVGSRTLAKKSELDLSPASIRNVLSDLEEMGYLRQPHTSAGRVPPVHRRPDARSRSDDRGGERHSRHVLVARARAERHARDRQASLAAHRYGGRGTCPALRDARAQAAALLAHGH